MTPYITSCALGDSLKAFIVRLSKDIRLKLSLSNFEELYCQSKLFWSERLAQERAAEFCKNCHAHKDAHLRDDVYDCGNFTPGDSQSSVSLDASGHEQADSNAPYGVRSDHPNEGCDSPKPDSYSDVRQILNFHDLKKHVEILGERSSTAERRLSDMSVVSFNRYQELNQRIEQLEQRVEKLEDRINDHFVHHKFMESMESMEAKNELVRRGKEACRTKC